MNNIQPTIDSSVDLIETFCIVNVHYETLENSVMFI